MMKATYSDRRLNSALIATVVSSVLLAACAAAPVQPAGSAEARNKLMQLQSDQSLAGRAPLAIKDADLAVSLAEQPQADLQLAAHRVYIADRKIDTARAQAETKLAEDQRAELSTQREDARLDARTQEADAAHAAAAASQAESVELQRQLDELHAQVTDRGIVLTLGDVLFATGRADLKPEATNNLMALVTFLNSYPNRTAAIEGYTDSVGSDDANQLLSERRAESVRSYLTGKGIGAARLAASGKGEMEPVGDNESATGRQRNRRVEVIINEPVAAL
jgi:outer membrane protein OmpA-like peptidoglycan-associated protein